MPLKLMYITNNPDVAFIAEKYGVERIWIDLESLGKDERQRNMNTVKSRHRIEDIRNIKPILTKSETLVRINPWNENSLWEIDSVIEAGADMIMLPMWKTADEVMLFLSTVHKRCKTTLLLETREAVECIDEVLSNGGFDEIHIGLNDLHLSYGLTFMFELLSNGMVEMLCKKFSSAGVPYGFGGIAKLGCGDLAAEHVIMEHYRLGSTRAILSRSFCNPEGTEDISQIENVFKTNMKILRDYEASINPKDYEKNKEVVSKAVDKVVADRKGTNRCL